MTQVNPKITKDALSASEDWVSFVAKLGHSIFNDNDTRSSDVLRTPPRRRLRDATHPGARK
jgi:hypothetical protein